MGSPKPLLPLGDGTFLAHLVDALRASRARPLVVVLGHEAEAVTRAVPLLDVEVRHNPRYREGMLSSVTVGLEAVEGAVDGVLLCPVDHPRLPPELVDRLIAAFEATDGPIVLPVFQGRRGHPVLLASRLFQELKSAPASVGARQVVWNHAAAIVEIATESEAVVEDIDTPERYRKLIET